MYPGRIANLKVLHSRIEPLIPPRAAVHILA